MTESGDSVANTQFKFNIYIWIYIMVNLKSPITSSQSGSSSGSVERIADMPVHDSQVRVAQLHFTD